MSPRGGVTGANALGATALAVTACWFPLIDRLDVSKLLVVVICASLFAAWRIVDGGDVTVGLGIGLLLAAALGTLVPDLRAALEAWLVPWLALLLWWLAGTVDGPRLVCWLAAAAVLQALLALQGLAGDPLGLAEQVAFQGRTAVGTFGNPTILGIWLAALLPLCFALRAPFPIPTAALLTAAVIATQSRTAMGLAALGALGAVVALRPKRSTSGLLTFFALVGLGGAAVGALLLRGVLASEPWSERLSATRVALSGFADSGAWFAGLGPEAFAHHWHLWRDSYGGPAGASFRHLHLDPLEWWIELGLLGLLLWLAPLYGLLARRREFSTLRALAAVGLVSLLLASLLQPTVVLVPGALLAASLGAITTPRRAGRGGRLLIAGVALFLAVACFYLAVRFASEWRRADATRARIVGAPSLERALSAAELDPTNDRAWLEVIMADGADTAIQRAAARKLRIKGLTTSLLRQSGISDPRPLDSRSKGK